MTHVHGYSTGKCFKRSNPTTKFEKKKNEEINEQTQKTLREPRQKPSEKNVFPCLAQNGLCAVSLFIWDLVLHAYPGLP